MSDIMSATDCVWYFVGEMRVPLSMGGVPVHYIGGAHNIASEHFAFVAPSVAMRGRVDFGDEDASTPFVTTGRSNGGFGFDRTVVKPEPITRTDALDVRVDPLPTFLSEPFGAGVYLGAVTPMISITYTYGSNPAMAVLLRQSNALNDGDVLTGDPEILAPSDLGATHLAETEAVLQDLIADVEAILPIASYDNLDVFENFTIENVSISDDVLSLQGAGENPPSVEANGTFVNSDKTADAGQTSEAQIAQIEALVESSYVMQADAGETPEPSNDPKSAGDPVDRVEISNDVRPGDSSDQTAATGGNQAMNAVVLTDAGEAFGSLIVEGDFYKTNVIVQINALSDTDDVKLSGEIVRDLVGAKNIATNEASFVNEPGALYGNPLLQGFAGATNWNVEYNTGNLIDVAIAAQTNVLRDGDSADVTSTTTEVLMMLGENGQLNLINLAELGKAYDLIIIAGDYYKLNAIIQINMLLDDDIVRVDSNGNANGQANKYAQTSGNTLWNDAAIVDSGAQSFKPLIGTPVDLVAAIEAGNTEIPALLSIGLPGNGTPDFDVLYIAGDYYDYNIISQTNLIYDADVLRMATDEAVPDALTQSAMTGGNAALNAAMIVDIGSTSHYQLLGGEVFEETFLIQADILIDDDNIVYSEEGHATLDPDVVAAVAAMNDGPDQGGALPPIPVAAADFANSDGLASVLN